MNFEPEVTIESALPEFAGVSFTIHQLTEGKRIQVRMDLAAHSARIRELALEKLQSDALPEAQDRMRAYYKVMYDMRELVDDHMNPVWLRNLLVSVQGLTIKGQPVTPDLLIQSGPTALYKEIVAAVRSAAGLSELESGE